MCIYCSYIEFFSVSVHCASLALAFSNSLNGYRFMFFNRWRTPQAALNTKRAPPKSVKIRYSTSSKEELTVKKQWPPWCLGFAWKSSIGFLKSLARKRTCLCDLETTRICWLGSCFCWWFESLNYGSVLLHPKYLPSWVFWRHGDVCGIGEEDKKLRFVPVFWLIFF